MRLNKNFLLTLVIVLLVSSPMLAQIDFPSNSGAEGPADAAPIDGLIGLGVMVGAYFGIRKSKK